MTTSFPVQLKSEFPDIDLENIDELLAQLTAEEIDELNGDFDPDNALLPPSERMKDQTKKQPTGKFDRKKLLDFLEKKAREEKDWEQFKPFIKELRGKVYKKKEEPKPVEDSEIETEWDEILKQASEEELVDLAAVLGFHGMLNQTQYYASWEGKEIEAGGGFRGVAKAADLLPLPMEPPNPTDVEDSLKRIKENDQKLKHLNLNNIKNISNERLIEFSEALTTNTHLETLEMANVKMTDTVAKKLAEGLRGNKTLKILNVESNFISGEVILEILKAINVHKSVIELRVVNQKPAVLGNKVEMQIAKLIEENGVILRFGITFEYPDARIRVDYKLQENNDALRKKRVGDKDGE
ncbi:hypothetical protein ACJMK2_024654 [Sinanodonta woodiana]|uniref:Tropomodulin n=1 Tax=Sinanodonta woodiana TaxID=1069815 RepID=A0ABD3XE16_SINWO